MKPAPPVTRNRKRLRSDTAGSVDGLAATNHQFTAEIVVLTDVLEEFFLYLQRDVVGIRSPRLRVCARIIDREFVPDLGHARPGQAFDGVELRSVDEATGCRVATINPEPVVVGNRID